MQEIVVIDGEISLENTLDGEIELEAITDLDPDVVMSAGGGITPSGTISITENGVYDVTEYASADVDVQGGITPTGTKQISITQNGTTTEDVTNYADVEVTTAVPASAVDTGTKSISTNGTHDVVGYASANVAVPASAVDSGTKSINANGTHDVIGYASASVAVPNSYSASDEGKVVSNGALVSQTSDTVTANDTYDTTLINSLTVNVSGGGGYNAEYPLGTVFVNSYARVSCANGHVKLEATSANNSTYVRFSGLSISGNITESNNRSTLFTIPAGATCVLKYENVINTSNRNWNANFKKANSGTSMSYGIGDSTHLSGETITNTHTTAEDVGTLFLYVAGLQAGDILEFDVSFTVNGTRYF